MQDNMNENILKVRFLLINYTHF